MNIALVPGPLLFSGWILFDPACLKTDSGAEG